MSGTELFLPIAGLLFQGVGTFAQARAQRAQAMAQGAALQAQAMRAREVAGAEAQDYRRSARRIAGSQRALVGGAGVAAEGSPLLLFEDLAAEAELQAQKILTAGLAEAATLQFEGDLTQRAGRANARNTLITGFGRTLLQGAPLLADTDFFGQQPLSAPGPKTIGAKTFRKTGFGLQRL